MKKIMKQIEELKLPIIIYGAGESGVFVLSLLKKLKMGNLCYFCDSDKSKWGKEKYGIRILSLPEIKENFAQFCCIVAITDKEQQLNVKELLASNGFLKYIYTYDDIFAQNTVEDNRMLCAVAHEDTFDDYFKSAENSLSVFWGEDSPFLRMFRELNLQKVVELAVGRGRHVTQYLDLAGHVTLVDILEKNIAFCKERFGNNPKISYYKNSGNDLSKLKDASYTSLFTYDAMVHFELIDVYNYLIETYRILQPGGKALFHHSNLHSDYKISFSNSPYHSRNYMSKEIFAYLAYRAGFKILEQQKIKWGVEDLDCLTLVHKL